MDTAGVAYVNRAYTSLFIGSHALDWLSVCLAGTTSRIFKFFVWRTCDFDASGLRATHYILDWYTTRRLYVNTTHSLSLSLSLSLSHILCFLRLAILSKTDFNTDPFLVRSCLSLHLVQPLFCSRPCIISVTYTTTHRHIERASSSSHLRWSL
jgi:hypothetical protein